MGRLTGGARLLGWLVLLAATALAVLLAGEPVGGLPPLHSLGAAHQWFADLDPPLVGAVVVRAVVVGACAYLVLATLLAAWADTTRRPRLARLAARATPRTVRRLVGRSLGLGLTASLAVGVVPPPAGPAPEPVTMQYLDPDDPAPPTTVIEPADPPPGTAPPRTAPPSTPPVQRWSPADLPPLAPPTTATAPAPVPPASPPTDAPARPPLEPAAPGAAPAPSHAADPVTAPAPPPPPPAAGRASDAEAPTLAPETWTIAPGEHLWAVAEATLADHRPAGEVSDGDIAAYLHVLIEANRHRLVDPDNPDLVHPGQVFVLPPPPAFVR